MESYMTPDPVFSIALSWFTAEGTEGDRICLFRGRNIPERYFGTQTLPYVFSIGYPFGATDATGLPTSAQYSMIEEFEDRYIAPIEQAQRGLIAFVKTTNGIVRYFLYVSNIDYVTDILTRVDSDLELSAGEDRDWNEYRAFLRGMRFYP